MLARRLVKSTKYINQFSFIYHFGRAKEKSKKLIAKYLLTALITPLIFALIMADSYANSVAAAADTARPYASECAAFQLKLKKTSRRDKQTSEHLKYIEIMTLRFFYFWSKDQLKNPTVKTSDVFVPLDLHCIDEKLWRVLFTDKLSELKEIFTIKLEANGSWYIKYHKDLDSTVFQGKLADGTLTTISKYLSELNRQLTLINPFDMFAKERSISGTDYSDISKEAKKFTSQQVVGFPCLTTGCFGGAPVDPWASRIDIANSQLFDQINVYNQKFDSGKYRENAANWDTSETNRAKTAMESAIGAIKSPEYLQDRFDVDIFRDYLKLSPKQSSGGESIIFESTASKFDEMLRSKNHQEMLKGSKIFYGGPNIGYRNYEDLLKQ